MKGSIQGAELQVIIYHGLTPLIGEHIDEARIRTFYRGSRKDAIQIIDTGSSLKSFKSLVEDAGKDNLWFLGRRSGNDGREAGTGDLELSILRTVRRYCLALAMGVGCRFVAASQRVANSERDHVEFPARSKPWVTPAQ